jgi:trehalose/maltose hydrolase-like predicted phosphorylase
MAQRVSYNSDAGRYEVLGVGGPDEYHPLCDNNAYTNFLAARLFEMAINTYGTLKEHHPEEFSRLAAALGIGDNDISLWSAMADGMYFPVNEATGLIEQCDGFFSLKEEWQEVGARFGGPAAEYHTCKGIKQPDVLLLFALYPERFGRHHLLSNWDYYERFVQHGSSLSPSIHALVAARAGLVQKAREYLLFSGRFPFDDHNGDARGGIQIGNAGGLWQAVIFGMAGVELREDGIRIDPHLPLEWKRLSFHLAFRGNRFSIEILPDRVVIAACDDNSGTVGFTCGERQLSISAGESAEMTL